jgi:hypothetical protein
MDMIQQIDCSDTKCAGGVGIASRSEVSGDFFELRQIVSMPVLVVTAHRMLQAVVNVVLNQRFLGLLDSFFDCLQLLGDINARTTVLQHGDHAAQVTVRSLESVDQRRVAGVNVGF